MRRYFSRRISFSILGNNMSTRHSICSKALLISNEVENLDDATIHGLMSRTKKEFKPEYGRGHSIYF